MEEALARARGANVEHGDQLSRRNPAQDAGGTAHPHVHDGRRLPDQFEAGGLVQELERNPQRPLDNLLAGHHDPQQRRQDQRHELQTEPAERPEADHAGSFGA
jgi:hypothetical protein